MWHLEGSMCSYGPITKYGQSSGDIQNDNISKVSETQHKNLVALKRHVGELPKVDKRLVLLCRYCQLLILFLQQNITLPAAAPAKCFSPINSIVHSNKQYYHQFLSLHKQ